MFFCFKDTETEVEKNLTNFLKVNGRVNTWVQAYQPPNSSSQRYKCLADRNPEYILHDM